MQEQAIVSPLTVSQGNGLRQASWYYSTSSYSASRAGGVYSGNSRSQVVRKIFPSGRGALRQSTAGQWPLHNQDSTAVI